MKTLSQMQSGLHRHQHGELFETSTFSYIYVIYVLEGEIFYLPHTKFKSGISEYYTYICMVFKKGLG